MLNKFLESKVTKKSIYQARITPPNKNNFLLYIN
jgi:hypothetical protein